eukprot:UN23637
MHTHSTSESYPQRDNKAWEEQRAQKQRQQQKQAEAVDQVYQCTGLDRELIRDILRQTKWDPQKAVQQILDTGMLGGYQQNFPPPPPISNAMPPPKLKKTISAADSEVPEQIHRGINIGDFPLKLGPETFYLPSLKQYDEKQKKNY